MLFVPFVQYPSVLLMEKCQLLVSDRSTAGQTQEGSSWKDPQGEMARDDFYEGEYKAVPGYDDSHMGVKSGLLSVVSDRGRCARVSLCLYLSLFMV